MRRPPPAGSPEAARAARSGAEARAPPPSASHPQVPLGPGPARSLAAEPSASATGGAYEDARQPRPGFYWPPSPRPRAHWLLLTAPPLPSAGPINTSTSRLRRASTGRAQASGSPPYWPAGGDTPEPTHVPADRLHFHWRRRTPDKAVSTN